MLNDEQKRRRSSAFCSAFIIHHSAIDSMSERLRILVVDDDEIDRMAVRRALKDAGVDAEVVETGAGEQGRQILRAEPFDCALVDNLLPDIDGLHLLRALAADG